MFGNVSRRPLLWCEKLPNGFLVSDLSMCSSLVYLWKPPYLSPNLLFNMEFYNFKISKLITEMGWR